MKDVTKFEKINTTPKTFDEMVREIMEQHLPSRKPKTKEETQRQLDYFIIEMNKAFKRAKDIKKYILPGLREKLK